MRNASWGLVLVSLVAGCGSKGPEFHVSGTIAGSYADGTGGTTTTDFRFPANTRIDAAPSSGDAGRGDGGANAYTGSCQLSGSARTVRIAYWDQQVLGLREVSIAMPSWANATCTDCERGRITLNIGGVSFTGTERNPAATGPGSCTFNATSGSNGMRLDVSCAGLTAAGDARSVNVSGNLTLTECD